MRFRQQLYHERFRRGGVALGVFAVGVNEFEAICSRQLKGEDAPRMLEHPDRAVGTWRLDALL